MAKTNLIEVVHGVPLDSPCYNGVRLPSHSDFPLSGADERHRTDMVMHRFTLTLLSIRVTLFGAQPKESREKERESEKERDREKIKQIRSCYSMKIAVYLNLSLKIAHYN